MYKKKELQLSYFSICEGKKLDDKIVTYFALKAGSTVTRKMVPIPRRARSFLVVILIHVNRKEAEEGETEQQQQFT